MKTLLVINDNSPEAIHAAEFSLLIAQKIGANIMLANNFIKQHQGIGRLPAGDVENHDPDSQPAQDLFAHLNLLNEGETIYKPEIEEIDISDLDENKLAEKINLDHIWMMVKGMPGLISTHHADHYLNVHVVLNKVLCPLLLIPADWPLKAIERLTYIADLRYCRLQVVKHLAELAKSWSADLSIAHISAKGLPDIAEKYGLEIFTEEICKNIDYGKLFFNNIKEKDLAKAVDVMINGMHNDILTMVNHRFHFEEIVGRYITDTMPLQITIPLLIFPY